MIYLNKNKENDIILTLNCDSSYTGTTFILELINQQTTQVIDISLNNISNYISRYNEFIISSGLTNITSGLYDYIIYDNLTGKTLLEEGLCEVKEITIPKTVQINKAKQKIVLIN